MLSTEDRKNRLEELLIRVQRNRISLEKKRSVATRQAPPGSPGIAAAAKDSEPLPLPAEPSPVATLSSMTPAAKEMAERVSLTGATPAEPEPTILKRGPMAVTPDEPQKPEIEVLGEEPSIRAANAVTKEVETVVPEAAQVSDDVRADAPTIQPQPEVVQQVFERQVFERAAHRPEAQPETKRVFEGEAVSSGDVAVVHGEPAQSWSLEAVLTRAWKLGLSK